jgi:hypothetical protein
MKFYTIFTLAFVLTFVGCKQNNQKTEQKTEVSAAPSDYKNTSPTTEATTITNNDIPDPCKLLSVEKLKSILNLTTLPDSRSGSPAGNPDRSCFYKVEDAKSNGGILIQVMINPLPEEINNYPSGILDSKMTTGEQDPSTGKAVKFLSLPELGDKGCYSFKAGKYHWKYNEDFLFMIAFNTTSKEADQKKFAIAIANEMMQNFKPTNK